MHEPYRSGDDVYVLPTAIDVPTVGTIPVNSFVLLAEQPVLVDTGLTIDSAEFIEALRSVIDPAELRWIWLTHDDTDHTGALPAVMEQAPDARLATHGLGVLRMRTWWPVPLERVHALAHGDLLDVGDRLLRALRPPTYDNPMSMALFDESTATLFSVDSFGAIVPRLSEEIDDFSEEELVGGMTAWATFDSPWSHLSDRSRFAAMLDEIRQLDAQRILSSHLPPVVGRAEQLLDVVASTPTPSRSSPRTRPPSTRSQLASLGRVRRMHPIDCNTSIQSDVMSGCSRHSHRRSSDCSVIRCGGS